MSQLIRVVKMVEGTSREDGGVLALSQSRGNSTHTPKRCARLHERIVKRQKHKRSRSFMIITWCWQSERKCTIGGKQREGAAEDGERRNCHAMDVWGRHKCSSSIRIIWLYESAAYMYRDNGRKRTAWWEIRGKLLGESPVMV